MTFASVSMSPFNILVMLKGLIIIVILYIVPIAIFLVIIMEVLGFPLDAIELDIVNIYVDSTTSFHSIYFGITLVSIHTNKLGLSSKLGGILILPSTHNLS